MPEVSIQIKIIIMGKTISKPKTKSLLIFHIQITQIISRMEVVWIVENIKNLKV